MNLDTIIAKVTAVDSTVTTVEDALTVANAQYRAGTPIITDSEYDLLLSESIMSDGDPTLMDYYHNNKALLDLPITMGSLDKIKTTEDVEHWMRRVPSSSIITLTPKYDGISTCITLRTAEDYTAYTRGTGTQGFDITPFVRAIGLPWLEPGTYYGEIVLSRTNLDKINSIRADLGLPLYKNTRNTVAGLLSANDPDLTFLPFLSIVLYGKANSIVNKSIELEYLTAVTGSPDLLYLTYPTTSVTTTTLNATYERFKQMLDVDIDGVVLDVDDAGLRTTLTSSTLNPAYAVAYKGFTQDSYATTVLSIDRTPNKDGIIIPTIGIEPVTIGGVTIKTLLGDSESFLKLYGIGVGTQVSIIRSGDVIPRIVAVEGVPVIPSAIMSKYKKELGYDLDAVRTQYVPTPDNYSPPTMDYEWDSTCSHVVTTETTDLMKIKNVVWFFQEIGAKGVSTGVVESLFSAGLTTIPAMLSVPMESLASIPGWGTVSATKFKTEITTKLNSATMDMILSGSNCFYKLGRKKLTPLVPVLFSPLEEVSKHLDSTPGIGTITKEAMLSGLPKFLEFYATIKPFITTNSTNSTSTTGTLHAGQKYVFTGVRDADLETYLESQGATIVSSISNQVTGVIRATPDSMSSKIKKAMELGIPILEYKDVKATIPTSTPTTLF